MPVSPLHHPLELLTFRSPRGQQNQQDIPDLKDNAVHFGFVSELLTCTLHSGTHIDALGHVTCGRNSTWYGGGLG
jgi:kynurenine formamidase